MHKPLGRRIFLWCALAVPVALAPLVKTLPGWLTLLLLALWLLALVFHAQGKNTPLLLRLLLALATTILALMTFDFHFGRDTGAALLATMLVLKLFELRGNRDARSVLGFALFAAMASFLLDQGPAMLGLAALGMWVSLAALAEIADREAGRSRPIHVAQRLRNAGLLALISLPLAITGFFLFPRLASPIWGVPGKATEARTGLSDEMSPGDIAELYTDDSPVLRVTFEGAMPGPDARYWRGPVLSDFDGRTWRRVSFWDGRETIPSVNPQPQSVVAYEITQEPTDRHYLMALDVPLRAPEGTRLDGARSLISTAPLERVSRHRLISATGYRLDMEMPRALRRWFTQLPGDFNPRTRALIQSWRQQGDNDQALIRHTLQRFTAEFTYTLRPHLLGRDSIDEFLFDTRAGYCEHFASAFTFMMRAAGIPARVVTGYQGGYFNPLGNHWVVRQSDAHAWSEVWLAGQGWVRVDPTAAVAPEWIERGIDGLPGGHGAAGWWVPFRNSADWLMREWNDLMLGFDAKRQVSVLRSFGLNGEDWRKIGLILTLTALFALVITFWLVLRERKPKPEPLLAAYHLLLTRLARAGAGKRSDEGPIDFAQRAASLLPALAPDLQWLIYRYVDWRYAGQAMNPQEYADLVGHLRRFRIPRRLRILNRGMP